MIVAEDRSCPIPQRPRISIDPEQRTIQFEWCHVSRSFFSAGFQQSYVCSFDDITGTADFLHGSHKAPVTRIILAAGRLISIHVSPKQLASTFIYTETGRCRMFASWHGFEEVRAQLAKIAPGQSRIPLSEDIRLIPLYVLGMLAITGGIVWALL